MKRLPSTFLFFLFSIFIFSYAESNAQFVIDENFSGETFPPAGWTIGPALDLDGFPVISRLTPSAYGIGTGSAFTYFYNWDTGSDSLTTPGFTATGLGDTLYFDHAYRTYTGGEVDSLVIYISNNGGATYTIFQQLPGGPTVGTGMVTAAPSSGNFVAPTAGQWASKKYGLPLGTNRVRFHVTTAYGNNLFLDNIRIGKTPSIDLAVLSNNTLPVQFAKGTSYTGMSTIINNGLAPASFTVTRTITPGGYINTKSIVGLLGGSDTNVVFDPFNFLSNTAYTVKDSISLIGDTNPLNDTLSSSTTLRTAKTIALLRVHQVSVDSLWAQLTRLGYGNQIDTISSLMPLTPWSTVIVPFASGSFWSAAFRDLMQDYLATAPVPGGGEFKRSLLIFGNDIGYNADPNSGGYSENAADSVFYRGYLRAEYLADNWLTSIPSAEGKFQGFAPNFSPSLMDSVGDPYPDMVSPINGGSAAFVPLTTTTGDTACAIAYSTSTYNVFYGSNVYSNYYSDASPLDAPIDVLGAINSFLDANGGVLPVELASFTATVSQRNVNLSWTTSGESNNSGFDIERRSVQEGNWSKVGFVTGSGTTSEAKTYSFSDIGVASGKYNYRLKQTDYNGNFEYFNLSSEIIVGVPNKFDLSQNYPNPFNPVTKINYDLPVDGKVMLKVYDVTGREIAQLINEIQPAGYYTVSFNASNFASGVYFYKLFTAGDNGQQFVMTKKMMLVK